MVPKDWPVDAMSAFLSRSLRRLLHSLHEGMIIKNLSAGQNLEVSRLANPQWNRQLIVSLQVADKTWAIIREEGAVVEEALEDDDGRSFLEKAGERDEMSTDAVIGTSFNEKSDGMHECWTGVVDINPGDHPIKDEDEHGVL